MRKGSLKWLILLIVIQYPFAYLCKGQSELANEIRNNWIWFHPLGFQLIAFMIFLLFKYLSFFIEWDNKKGDFAFKK